MKLAYAGIALLVTLTAGEPAHAERLRYLPRAEQGLAQLLADIESAHSSIDLTYYIWDPCSVVGRVVIRALEKKHAESPGVPMRLVLDASCQADPKRRSEITATMARRGVDVRFYNDTMDARRNIRTHIKFVVVDGKKVVSGGRNIADDYYGLSKSMNWVDREAHLEGAAAAGAVEGFDRLWNDQLTFREKRAASPAEAEAAERECLKPDAKTLAVEKYMAQNKARILAGAPERACREALMTVDHPDYAEGLAEDEADYLSGERLQRKETSREVLSLLSHAQRSLLVENYTYIPTGDVQRMFARYRTEGHVPVKIVTNNAYDEDQGVMRPAATYYQRADSQGSQRILAVPKGRLISDDWAMSPGHTPYQIHAKDAVVDGKHAVVSSFNMDPRSFHTNLESAIVVRNCPAFASDVSGTIDRTYDVAERVLASPAVQRCREQVEQPGGALNNLLGWAAHEFL